MRLSNCQLPLELSLVLDFNQVYSSSIANHRGLDLDVALSSQWLRVEPANPKGIFLGSKCRTAKTTQIPFNACRIHFALDLADLRPENLTWHTTQYRRRGSYRELLSQLLPPEGRGRGLS